MGWEATRLTFAGFYHTFRGGLAISWSRMGSAGMTKLFSLGFSHPSSRQSRTCSHGGWTWLKFTLRLSYCHFFTIFLGRVTIPAQIWGAGKVSTAGWEGCKITLQRIWIQGKVENCGHFSIQSTILLYLTFLMRNNSQGLTNICEALKIWTLLHQHVTITRSLHRASQLCT